MMVISIEQHLRNIWSSIHEKVKYTQAEWVLFKANLLRYFE